MIPKVLTKTVNLGDSVTLEMDIQDHGGGNLAWHFNERDLGESYNICDIP